MVITSRRSPSLASMALLSLALFAGCTAAPGGPAGPGGASDAATTRPAGSQVAIPSASGAPAEGAVPDEILQKAIADAAQQAGVDPSAVTVVSAEATTWNSGALGCPEPGKVYTQALVPGYKIVLEAGGQHHELPRIRDRQRQAVRGRRRLLSGAAARRITRPRPVVGASSCVRWMAGRPAAEV